MQSGAPQHNAGAGSERLECSLCRWDDARSTRIDFNRHAQCPRKSLEDGFALMVRVITAQVVDMQGYLGVIGESLKKFMRKIDIELPDKGAGEVNMEFHARASRKIDDDPGQRLIQRHVGVAVAPQTLFVTHGLGDGLAQGNSDVLDRMMSVDMQIAPGVHFQVDHAMARNLVQHVVEERHPGGQAGLACSIQINGDADLGFCRVTLDCCFTHLLIHTKNSPIGGKMAD